MIKVYIQPLAKKDLKGIWHYTLANWGEKQTIKYYYKITDSIKSLSNNPYIGVTCDYIKQGYRKYQVEKHFIIYKVTKNTIYVIRVLSTKMDFTLHL